MPRPRALVTPGLGLVLLLGGLVITAAPAAAQAAPAAEHVVQPGEYLGAIAQRYATTVRRLADLNQLPDPNRVRVGQHLALPAPAALTTTSSGSSTTSASGSSGSGVTTVAHTVVAGEHLTSIADQYGTTVRAIVDANKIRNPNLVRVGAVLQVPVPVSDRLPDRLRQSPDRLALRPAFQHWADEYGTPADLLQAMCWLESGWQSAKVSPDGAVGVCQFLPSTAAFISQLIGTSLDPAVAEEGVRLGARYLRYLLDQTGGDEAAALAGYVQGLRSVAERGRFDETQDYVDAVLALRDRFA